MTLLQLYDTALKHGYTSNLIDFLEEIGLIKADEPPNTAMDKLEDGLRRRYFHDAEMIGLKQALKDLGLEVVEKTKR